MLEITVSGSWHETERFLREAPKTNIRHILESLGQKGVRALSSATPQESGLAARSWYYNVKRTASGWEIIWSNSDIENGFPVAIMLQYGHATGTGGWVQGTDYINPALKPIFDEIADRAWKAVNGK